MLRISYLLPHAIVVPPLITQTSPSPTTGMSGPAAKKSVQVARRLHGFDAPTVWGEFTPLAVQHRAVNLGQGFPDWETPQFIKDALCRSVQGSGNQYARSAGDLRLVEALARHYSPLLGREVDPLSEVAVSSGATGVMFAVLQGLLNEGDEVVVMEPAFDIYAAQIQMAGATPVYVPLRVERTESRERWVLDMAELEAAFSPRTRLVILNTPHNPTGKVFSLKELQDIAAILERHPQVTAVTDEVYEKLIFDGGRHERLASLPGMWDRVVTISSCGKTFSCTGWKIGWALGAAHLIKPMVLTNQWTTYCVSTPTQQALAEVLRQSEEPYEGHPSYFDYIRAEYERKRDHLVSSLKLAELRPIVPEGGFFVVAHTGAHSVPEKYALQVLFAQPLEPID